MTGSWLPLNKARTELGLTWNQFNDLIEAGQIDLELIGDHYSVSEQRVSELAAHGGDDLAENGKPTVGRWSRAAEPDSFAERGDYTDTPNDEGEQH